MQIKIKGQAYTIKIDNKIIDNKLGSCNVKDKILRIVKEDSQPLDTMQTIIHELVHAHLYECGSSAYGDEDFTFWCETQFLPILDSFFNIMQAIYPTEKENIIKMRKYVNWLTKQV